MADHNPAPPTTGVSFTGRLLCSVYAVIAVVALVATWSQNIAYLDSPAGFLIDFLDDTKANPGSRSMTVDILLLFLSAAILMVTEARKHGVRFVWLYILGGFAIAISVTFPLFLIARELRIGAAGRRPVTVVDAVGLAALAAALLALVLWVDLG